MLGNMPVAVSAPRVADANGAPAQHKHDPNELAGKIRHHLTLRLICAVCVYWGPGSLAALGPGNDAASATNVKAAPRGAIYRLDTKLTTPAHLDRLVWKNENPAWI